MQIIARIFSLLVVVMFIALLMGTVTSPQDPVSQPSKYAVQRHAAAKELMDHAAKREQAGRGWVGPSTDLEARVIWSLRLAKAAVAVGEKEGVQSHIERMEKLLGSTKSLYDAGRGSDLDIAMCRYYLAEAHLLAEQVVNK